MSLQVEATYENGVLKLDKPLPLDEHERVTVHIKSHTNRIWSHAGSLKWTGDPEVLRKVAEDPEFGISESP
jgi:predicted DNA-binding antitoxin AbrB/MazE fold protein